MIRRSKNVSSVAFSDRPQRYLRPSFAFVGCIHSVQSAQHDWSMGPPRTQQAAAPALFCRPGSAFCKTTLPLPTNLSHADALTPASEPLRQIPCNHRVKLVTGQSHLNLNFPIGENGVKSYFRLKQATTVSDRKKWLQKFLMLQVTSGL